MRLFAVNCLSKLVKQFCTGYAGSKMAVPHYRYATCHCKQLIIPPYQAMLFLSSDSMQGAVACACGAVPDL